MNYIIKIFLFILLSTVVTGTYAQGKAPAANPLSMSGWNLESNPNVGNSTQESGMISYEIEIDSVGNLLTVKVLKKTISDELAQKCEDEIRKMNFVKNVSNTNRSTTSKGTITFVFKVQ